MTTRETFKGYKVYGPYLSKAEQRRMVALVSDDHRTTMSYARYLVCREVGDFLPSDVEVDHINKDKLDDRIENLQVLKKAAHAKKDAPGKTMITLTCPECQEDFTRERRQVIYKKRKLPPCCSRSCSGRFQHR